ncbi:MAG: 30S ribosomal protein S6 [Candidatus Cloacimonetes bacterium]|nr:30S ribosomal protein S6 [Candidatus Cloacimonadota bacterium]
MNKYESMVVFHGDLTPEDVNREHEGILALVKQLEGELLDADQWGKRRLAYPIQKVNEGYYIVYTFRFDPKNLPELERHYRLQTEIIRYNILLKEQEA